MRGTVHDPAYTSKHMYTVTSWPCSSFTLVPRDRIYILFSREHIICIKIYRFFLREQPLVSQPYNGTAKRKTEDATMDSAIAIKRPRRIPLATPLPPKDSTTGLEEEKEGEYSSSLSDVDNYGLSPEIANS